MDTGQEEKTAGRIEAWRRFDGICALTVSKLSDQVWG